MVILVFQTDHAADGSDCDVYVRPNAQPTLTQYTLRNVTMDNHIVLVVPSPGDTPYWVGIYGYSSCTYRLKFTRVSNPPLFTWCHHSLLSRQL